MLTMCIPDWASHSAQYVTPRSVPPSISVHFAPQAFSIFARIAGMPPPGSPPTITRSIPSSLALHPSTSGAFSARCRTKFGAPTTQRGRVSAQARSRRSAPPSAPTGTSIVPMYCNPCITGMPPTKPLASENACNTISPGRTPLAKKQRAVISCHISASDSVRATYEGLPVVPDEACIWMMSDIGAARCLPKGGSAARLSRISVL